MTLADTHGESRPPVVLEGVQRRGRLVEKWNREREKRSKCLFWIEIRGHWSVPTVVPTSSCCFRISCGFSAVMQTVGNGLYFNTLQTFWGEQKKVFQDVQSVFLWLWLLLLEGDLFCVLSSGQRQFAMTTPHPPRFYCLKRTFSLWRNWELFLFVCCCSLFLLNVLQELDSGRVRSSCFRPTRLDCMFSWKVVCCFLTLFFFFPNAWLVPRWAALSTARQGTGCPRSLHVTATSAHFHSATRGTLFFGVLQCFF